MRWYAHTRYIRWKERIRVRWFAKHSWNSDFLSLNSISIYSGGDSRHRRRFSSSSSSSSPPLPDKNLSPRERKGEASSLIDPHRVESVREKFPGSGIPMICRLNWFRRGLGKQCRGKKKRKGERRKSIAIFVSRMMKPRIFSSFAELNVFSPPSSSFHSTSSCFALVRFQFYSSNISPILELGGNPFGDVIKQSDRCDATFHRYCV